MALNMKNRMVLMCICAALAVAFVHAAEVGGIITQRLDMGAALKKSYDAKVARQDKVKVWKEIADSTPISEDFTTATMLAINEVYDRVMAIDLTAARAKARAFDLEMAIKAEIQGFKNEALNRQANIARIKADPDFVDDVPGVKPVRDFGIGIIDGVVSDFDNPLVKEYYDYKMPRVIED